MTVKIGDITGKNFPDIPRPANRRFNCQECFYWMGKKDGKYDLVKQKRKWFLKEEKKQKGPLGKLLLWGKREKPVGFIQFGPVTNFETALLFYRILASQDQSSSDFGEGLDLLPHGAWCITCVAIQSGYRRKGLATRLVRNVLRDLKRRGVKIVEAYPLKEIGSLNQVSEGIVPLWEKCGFERADEIKGRKIRLLMRRKF